MPKPERLQFKKGKSQMAKSDVEKNADVEEISLRDECPEHDRHLCHIINLRNMKTAGSLSKDARFLCFICGRAAKAAQNLCEPVKI